MFDVVFSGAEEADGENRESGISRKWVTALVYDNTGTQSALEAIIYAADEPVTLEQLARALGRREDGGACGARLIGAAVQSDERGIEIRAVAGGYKYYTKPQHHDVVRRFIKSLRPPVRLTMPALETLAVIAYKQPVDAAGDQEIRGVNCAGVIKTLLEKRLITTAGRKKAIGRPILYRTSKEFLMRFGLADLEELPSLKEFEALAREALGSDDGIAPIEPEESALAAAESTATETGSPAIGEEPKAVAAAAAAAGNSTSNTSISEMILGRSELRRKRQ